MYAHCLLGFTARKMFAELKPSEFVYLNIYENHHIGDVKHDSREEAAKFSAGSQVPTWYRLKIIRK